MINKIPDVTHAAAVFNKFDKVLAGKLTFISNFDDQVKLYRTYGEEMWVPRNIVPMGVVDAREAGAVVLYHSGFKPRSEDQSEVIEKAFTLLNGGESFIIEAPTGYGKTFIGSELIARVGRRALIITTKEDIVDQWCEALKKTLGLGVSEIGLWRGDSVPAPSAKVVISLVQSVMKGYTRYSPSLYKGYGLVICDEVHRMGADEFSQAMWWFPAKLRLGLSATADRRDGKAVVFKAHIGPIRVKAKQKVLPFKVLVAKTTWTIPKVYRDGEMVPCPHKPGRIMELMDSFVQNDDRNALICNFVRSAVLKGRYTIVFCDTVAHLKRLYELLCCMGIHHSKIGYYVGISSSTDAYQGSAGSKKMQREVAKSKPILLATYKMASEATDIPWLDTCVLGTPKSDVRQIVGRILREYDDKKEPVVFDLVDYRSRVLDNYFKSRSRWYKAVSASVKIIT